MLRVTLSATRDPARVGDRSEDAGEDNDENHHHRDEHTDVPGGNDQQQAAQVWIGTLLYLLYAYIVYALRRTVAAAGRRPTTCGQAVDGSSG
jgi:hypothetical protein